MDYKKETICMFTGHRNIMDINPEHMSRLAPEIYKAIAFGKTTFLCGGARGWDTYTAMTIIAIKANRPEVKLVLVLPCCKAEQTKYWGNTHIAFYDTVFSCADDVIYISENYYDKCYYDRNAKMVEMSSYCICYLKNEKSGTGQTVNMARKNGLEVVNIADGGHENE
jgi:uncharacterized phage-like protein YoqJ